MLVTVLSGINAAHAASDGTAIGNLADEMQAGTWAELTTNGASVLGSSDPDHSILEYTDEMKWDSLTKRAFFVGTPDPYRDSGAGKFVQYDAATDTRPGATCLVEYNLGTKTWSHIAGRPWPDVGILHTTMEYNPVHKVMWFGGGDDSNKMLRLNANGTVTNLATPPIPLIVQNTHGTSWSAVLSSRD
jgi:hypothetical protein